MGGYSGLAGPDLFSFFFFSVIVVYIRGRVCNFCRLAWIGDAVMAYIFFLLLGDTKRQSGAETFYDFTF